MTLTLRGVVVLLTGNVFGLGLALSGTVLDYLTGRPKAAAAPLDPTIESAALVAEVIDRVRREYVDSVDDKRIVEAAIRGIVADLDQHSTFLNAEEYEDIRISTTGNYTGVGLDVNLAGAGRVQPAEEVQQRALARSRRADDRDALAHADVEVHAVQHLDVERSAGIALGEAAAREDRRRVTHSAAPPRD